LQVDRTVASPSSPGWRRFINRAIAEEVNVLARYSDQVIQWLPRKQDDGYLLSLLDAPLRRSVSEQDSFPDLTSEPDRQTLVLINGTFNHHTDIQDLLSKLGANAARSTRVGVVLYNPYLKWLYKIANRFGWRQGELPCTFLTRMDMEVLAKLSGFEVVRQRHIGYSPWRLFGLGYLLNHVMPLVPLLRWLSFAYLVVLRPLAEERPSGISCIIPARNERGNIEHALKRMPDLGCKLELIFVEGHSNDGTWEEIQRVAEAYKDRYEIKCFQQKARGKADAVRLGVAHATQPLVTILDADLTMPPEMLGRFYEAYCAGHGDFVNGSRLVYPMESGAMPFVNLLGNIFFAKWLSYIFDSRVGDSLCGTKLFSRRDYQRMVAWRRDFGDFDPFGDFELLFPAAIFGLKILDIPIAYRARAYGQTNIRPFKEGFTLLKMTLIGFFRIKLGMRRRVRP
jgi:hypothetical protein